MNRYTVLSGKTTDKIIKTLELPENHFIYKATSDVAELAAPFFQRYGFNFFQYGRVYKNGFVSILVNDLNWIKSYYAEQRPVLSHINDDKINEGSYQFLWENNLPEEAVMFCKNFQHDYGLCHVEIQKDYYDLISFAGSSDNYQLRDIYITDLDIIKNFIFYFKDKGSRLLQKMDENAFPLPLKMRDQHHKEYFNHTPTSMHSNFLLPRRYHFTHLNQKSHITRQEYLTLRDLAQGFSQREIAFRLKKSSRTIETYLMRMKQRLGCYNKRDLLQIYFKYF